MNSEQQASNDSSNIQIFNQFIPHLTAGRILTYLLTYLQTENTPSEMGDETTHNNYK